MHDQPPIEPGGLGLVDVAAVMADLEHLTPEERADLVFTDDETILAAR